MDCKTSVHMWRGLSTTAAPPDLESAVVALDDRVAALEGNRAFLSGNLRIFSGIYDFFCKLLARIRQLERL